MYWIACSLVLFACYSSTILMTSVGYHRGLTHGAVRLHPLTRRALLVAGHWLTGIDPKAWVVMHRLHHRHSDQPEDPHSPMNVGIVGIPWEQIKSYARVLAGLRRNDPYYTDVAPEVPMSWPVVTGFWFVPHVLHLAISIAIGVGMDAWLLAAAYWMGMMSHGTQGVVINAFGHAWGGRNFDTDDNSRNNHVAAWFLLGEGFQNNHHRYPASARFSYAAGEVDLGYAACRLLEVLGVLAIERSTLIPTAPPAFAKDPEVNDVGLPWMLRSPLSFAVFRLCVYGTVGLASEIFFYNLTRWGRATPWLAWAFRFEWQVDPSLNLDGVWTAPPAALFGQVSLWMFLVYGLCSLFIIEPFYRRLRGMPFLIRGVCYALAVLVYEWCAGWALWSLTGVSIWVYTDPWALGGGMTSLALLPAWVVSGLFAERLYRGMTALAPLVALARSRETLDAPLAELAPGSQRFR